ncbi:MAG: hypothetical protein JWN21_2312 [Sphingomonas bacterium]|nr:hypothetical protein [Sphingomonas bacterium]
MSTPLRWLAAALLALALATSGWFGWRAWRGPDAAPAVVQDLADDAAGAETVQTVRMDAPTIATTGTTPMAERVTVLGLLNKRNGDARDVTLKPGQGVEIGDVRIRLRACERTAPWEPEQLTGAFAQVDIRGVDRVWRRPFSGWLYKERPNINVVQHPVYDVWVKSCTMSFPVSGPETERLATSAPPSNAKKSTGGAGAVAADTPTKPVNAADSATR